MVLTSAPLRVTADARMRDYTSPSVEGSYQAVVSGGELGKLLKNKLLPGGQINTKGIVRYRSDPAKTLAGQPVYRGTTRQPGTGNRFAGSTHQRSVVQRGISLVLAVLLKPESCRRRSWAVMWPLI